MTPNRVQRGSNKKRRVPLALLIVPVVLVAIGVAILLALRGGEGAIIGGVRLYDQLTAATLRDCLSDLLDYWGT